MYFTYVLISKLVKKTYVGSTKDINRRLLEHNLGKCKFTRNYIPFEVLHFENFDTLKEAMVKEKFYKSTSGRRKLKEFVEQYNKMNCFEGFGEVAEWLNAIAC